MRQLAGMREAPKSHKTKNTIMQNWNQWQVSSGTGVMSQPPTAPAYPAPGADPMATMQAYMQYFNQPAPTGYTAEQWSAAQQQNWAQWQQWQQQYQQWQTQYGAKYQETMKQMSASGITGFPAMPKIQPPPLPKEELSAKPPLPPDNANPYHQLLPHQNNLPLFPTNNSKNPPLPPGQPPLPPNNPPPHESDLTGTKRTANSALDFDSAKKSKIEDEELTRAEKKFDRDFRDWEEKFNLWKQQNANHPDKEQYKAYTAMWMSCRETLIERREKMRKKREAQRAKAEAEKQKTLTSGENLQNIITNTENQGLINNLIGIGKALGLSGKDAPSTLGSNLAASASSSSIQSIEQSTIDGVPTTMTSDMNQQAWAAQQWAAQYNANNQIANMTAPSYPGYQTSIMPPPLMAVEPLAPPNIPNFNQSYSSNMNFGQTQPDFSLNSQGPGGNLNSPFRRDNDISLNKKDSFDQSHDRFGPNDRRGPDQDSQFRSNGSFNRDGPNNRFNQDDRNDFSDNRFRDGPKNMDAGGRGLGNDFRGDRDRPGSRIMDDDRFGRNDGRFREQDRFSNLDSGRKDSGNNMNFDNRGSGMNDRRFSNDRFAMPGDRFNDQNRFGPDRGPMTNDRPGMDRFGMNRFDSKDSMDRKDQFGDSMRPFDRNTRFDPPDEMSPELRKLMEKRRAAMDVFKPSGSFLGADKSSTNFGSLSESFKKITGDSPFLPRDRPSEFGKDRGLLDRGREFSGPFGGPGMPDRFRDDFRNRGLDMMRPRGLNDFNIRMDSMGPRKSNDFGPRGGNFGPDSQRPLSRDNRPPFRTSAPENQEFDRPSQASGSGPEKNEREKDKINNQELDKAPPAADTKDKLMEKVAESVKNVPPLEMPPWIDPKLMQDHTIKSEHSQDVDKPASGSDKPVDCEPPDDSSLNKDNKAFEFIKKSDVLPFMGENDPKAEDQNMEPPPKLADLGPIRSSDNTPFQTKPSSSPVARPGLFDAPFEPKGMPPFGPRSMRDFSTGSFPPRGPNDGPSGVNEPFSGFQRPNDGSFDSRGPNDGPFGPRGQNDGPFRPRGLNDGPFGPRGPNDGPFGPSRGSNDGPFGSRGPNDRPFGPRGPNDGPFGPNNGPFERQGLNDGPFGPRGPNDGPFGPRAANDGPFGPNDRPFGPRGPNDEPFGPRGPNDGPFGPRGPNDGPSGPRGPNDGPFGPRGPNDGPFGPRGSNDGPFGPRGPNDGPFERQGLNDGPFGHRGPNDFPSRGSNEGPFAPRRPSDGQFDSKGPNQDFYGPRGHLDERFGPRDSDNCGPRGPNAPMGPRGFNERPFPPNEPPFGAPRGPNEQPFGPSDGPRGKIPSLLSFKFDGPGINLKEPRDHMMRDANHPQDHSSRDDGNRMPFNQMPDDNRPNMQSDRDMRPTFPGGPGEFLPNQAKIPMCGPEDRPFIHPDAKDLPRPCLPAPESGPPVGSGESVSESNDSRLDDDRTSFSRRPPSQPGHRRSGPMQQGFCVGKQFNYNHGDGARDEVVEEFVPSKVIEYGHIRRSTAQDYIKPNEFYDYSHGKIIPNVSMHQIYPRMNFKYWQENDHNLREYNEGLCVYENRQKRLKDMEKRIKRDDSPGRRYEEHARMQGRHSPWEGRSTKSWRDAPRDAAKYRDVKDYGEPQEYRSHRSKRDSNKSREGDSEIHHEKRAPKNAGEDSRTSEKSRTRRDSNSENSKDSERFKESLIQPETPPTNPTESPTHEPSTQDDVILEAPSPPKTLELAKLSNVTMVDDLLCSPGRQNRPPKIAIILRGAPGSGKSYVAKLIKDKELEQGGSAPRILSLDDYFLIEKEVEGHDDNGKKTITKEMVYEYEEAMEPSYVTSLIKAFKKNVTDGFFNFIILDWINEKIADYEEMWSFAKSKGFRVYVAEMEMDVQICLKRNVHKRTEEEINRIVDYFEPTPNHHQKLDVSCLLQEQAIEEVQMEEAETESGEKTADINDDSQESQEEQSDSVGVSKWEKMEAEDKLDRLDGLAKRKNEGKPQTMEDFLQVPDYYNMEDTSGKKRVRWADLEERKEQEKMRAVGFVVGQTNWNRMMDPTKGGSALTRTKFFNLT